MLSGDIYDVNNDVALLKEQAIRKEFCYQYNQLQSSNTTE